MEWNDISHIHTRSCVKKNIGMWRVVIGVHFAFYELHGYLKISNRFGGGISRILENYFRKVLNMIKLKKDF